MVRSRPSADPFGSNRRSAAAQRRKREGPTQSDDMLQTQEEKSESFRRNGSCKGADEEASKLQGVSGPAEVSVEKKENLFEVRGNMSMAVHPDVTYGILVDYENNARIFKTVSSVKIEQREDTKLVTQSAHWNLMFWSGTFDMKMRVEEDRLKRAVSFRLDQPGFLKVFNGDWGIEPWQVEGQPLGSKVVVKQQILPSLQPPGLLAFYVSRIMGNQVKAVLEDLMKEAMAVQKRAEDSGKSYS